MNELNNLYHIQLKFVYGYIFITFSKVFRNQTVKDENYIIHIEGLNLRNILPNDKSITKKDIGNS